MPENQKLSIILSPFELLSVHYLNCDRNNGPLNECTNFNLLNIRLINQIPTEQRGPEIRTSLDFEWWKKEVVLQMVQILNGI